MNSNKRINLSESNIEQVKDWIKAQISISARCIDDKANNRYLFVDDKYGCVIGSLDFNLKTNTYEKFKVNSNFREEYDALEFKVRTNSINNVQDVILIEWAKYAMDNLTIEYGSKDIEGNRHIVYQNLYAPIITSYNSYVDFSNNIPSEYAKDARKKLYNDFRSNVNYFNKNLSGLGFGKYCYEKSYYYEAILVGEDGNVLYGNDIVNRNNSYVDRNGMKYNIFIKAKLVPNNNYAYKALPMDSIFHNGCSYVNISHVNDFK